MNMGNVLNRFLIPSLGANVLCSLIGIPVGAAKVLSGWESKCRVLPSFTSMNES